jgi:DNA-binding response OmpR family regulator
LIRRARRLPGRRRVPIIMLSASDVEAPARRAGADAFLRKPGGIVRLAETVARLLGWVPAILRQWARDNPRARTTSVAKANVFATPIKGLS